MDNLDNKYRDELKIYIEEKLVSLRKKYFFFNKISLIIKTLQIVLNLAIIVLAAFAIYSQVDWIRKLTPEQKVKLADDGDSFWLTMAVALFIILTFFLTMFLSVYTSIMKFADYKKAMREIQFIYIKRKEDGEHYSQEQFEKDLNTIEKNYLTKKNVSKIKLVAKYILEGKYK